MAHSLYVSDLDGTLLDTDGYLSPPTRQALADFFQAGIPFTVASGRTFSSIRRALGKTQLGLPVISSDGALISDFDSPAPLHLFAMEPTALRRLLDDLVERGFHPVLDLWDGQQNYMLSSGLQNPVMAWYHDHKQVEAFYRYQFRSDLGFPETAQTISVTLLDRPEWLEPLRDDLQELYGDVFKTDYAVLKEVENGAALWIQNVDARKEKALAILTERLGFDDSEVVVFGDELNDLGMFGKDWHSVAVGNARDELKSLAHCVIGPHTENSVVAFIREHAKG